MAERLRRRSSAGQSSAASRNASQVPPATAAIGSPSRVPAGKATGRHPRASGSHLTTNLATAFLQEELDELWDAANIAIGRLMAGLVGRREWDDDVMELHNALYDDICDNGFTPNLYNAVV
jgi:hypothetical protein